MCYTTVYVPDMTNMIVVLAGTVEKSATVCVLYYCIYVPDMTNMIVVLAGTVEKSATVCVLYYCICPGYEEYDCCVGRYCREVCNSLCAILLSVYMSRI